MRFSTSALAVTALAASSTMAQVTPSALATSLLGYLTSNCQQVVLSLVLPSTPFGQCFHVSSLLPILSTNGSVVPGIDAYLYETCSTAPCSNATLTNVTSQITTGCATDLAKFGISNQTVAQVFGLYPLAREVACLKTTNATIPVSNSTYNTTGGTFCATELLTEVSKYLGANLTNSYIDTAILGGNATTLQVLKSLPPTALCQDCIFAGLDLIEEEFPAIGNYSISKNVTVNQYLGSTCNATGYTVSSNGTLPKTITESAVNSTFGYNITVGNTTIKPTNGSYPGPKTVNITLRGEPAMKKRWFGAN